MGASAGPRKRRWGQRGAGSKQPLPCSFLDSLRCRIEKRSARAPWTPHGEGSGYSAIFMSCYVLNPLNVSFRSEALSAASGDRVFSTPEDTDHSPAPSRAPRNHPHQLCRAVLPHTSLSGLMSPQTLHQGHPALSHRGFCRSPAEGPGNPRGHPTLSQRLLQEPSWAPWEPPRVPVHWKLDVQVPRDSWQDYFIATAPPT